MTNFFIYGTLKRGHGRSALLDGQHFLGEKKTAPRYRLFTTGSFPALVDAGRANVMLPGMSIEGELWQIDDECLAVLDRVEGVDSGLFERGRLSCWTMRGRRRRTFSRAVSRDCWTSEQGGISGSLRPNIRIEPNNHELAVDFSFARYVAVRRHQDQRLAACQRRGILQI